jgi:hypothetical protein
MSTKHASWVVSLAGVLTLAAVGVAFAARPQKFEGYSGSYTEQNAGGSFQENIDFATTRSGRRVRDFDITFAPDGCGVAVASVLPPNAGATVSKHGTFKAKLALVLGAPIVSSTGGYVRGSYHHRVGTLVVTGQFLTPQTAQGTITSTYKANDYPTYTYGHPMGTCDVTRPYSAKAGGHPIKYR